MKSKQMMFFAEKDDLTSILLEIEEISEIMYVEMGLFDSNEIKQHHSCLAIPDLGHTKYGNWISLDHTYMIMSRDSLIYSRSIPQKKGGIKYAFDMMLNNDSMELSSGGIYPFQDSIMPQQMLSHTYMSTSYATTWAIPA